ncbi:MAG: hypothetical protein LBT14_09680, partial [Treponema sp.]|nr:hypothetical protein [Treponema sp.]
IDSTPESHPVLGEAFHIYLPPIIQYGYENTRHKTVEVQDGVYINIRGFALPYADYTGPFQDNPFIMRITPQSSEPPEENPMQAKDPKVPIPTVVLPEPRYPAMVLPEPEYPRYLLEPVDPDHAPPESADPAEQTESSDTAIDRPHEEPPVFTPVTVISAEAGLRAFHPGPVQELPLQSRYEGIGTIELTRKQTKILGFNLSFERDLLLLNRIFTRAEVDLGFIDFAIGPYFGIFNTNANIVSPGLSMVLKLRLFSGMLSGSFRLDTYLGWRNLTDPGDYSQDAYEIKLGVQIPVAMITLSMSDRTIVEKDDWAITLTQHWIRYNLSTEFSKPPGPFGFRFNLGYQQLTCTYAVAMPLDYFYHDIYVGLGASYKIRPHIKLFLEAEAPIWPWQYGAMQSLRDPQVPLLYGASLGVVWTLMR